MRFSIAHILVGIKALKVEQVEAAIAKRDELQEKQLARLARVAEAPAKVSGMLDDLALTVSEMTEARSDSFLYWGKSWGREIYEYTRRLPSLYDVGHGQELVDKQDKLIASLQYPSHTADEFELFLEALADGGETHISQSALKLAGFRNVKVADYITARARAQATETKE